MYNQILKELQIYEDKKYADWFKPFLSITSDTQDKLMGIRVPILRRIAKKYKNIDINIIEQLLSDEFHEMRELALFIMVLRSKQEPKQMCNLYLKNLKTINNWDLIDYTAPHIVAPVISKINLIKLSETDDLWINRVAIISTIYYIKQHDYDLILDFAKKYLTHPHHLIHKAVGWMLREVGKRDEKVLTDFLKEYASEMPSVMRSYANEKLKLVL